MKCIDRSSQQTSEYALYLSCPEHTPAHRCVDGMVGVGHKQSFHGETVYAEMLIESEKILTSMKKVGWIDIQTDKVSMSTMVYTEDLEMFTSLTVEFSFDFAGNVEGAVHMVTYRDLTQDTASEFQGFLITTCVGAFISMVSLVAFLCLHPEKYNLGLMLYEIISRIVLLVYPLILLITWAQQVPMSHEYDLLLQTFLNNEGMDEAHLHHSVAEYFKVKSVIMAGASPCRGLCGALRAVSADGLGLQCASTGGHVNINGAEGFVQHDALLLCFRHPLLDAGVYGKLPLGRSHSHFWHLWQCMFGTSSHAFWRIHLC